LPGKVNVDFTQGRYLHVGQPPQGLHVGGADKTCTYYTNFDFVHSLLRVKKLKKEP
jgi:hypothetical protein